MIKVILSDLSRTCLFIKDEKYSGTLNVLYKELNEAGEPFNFFDYFFLNKEYLQILSSYKDRFGLNMFTSGSIQKDKTLYPKLKEVFNEILDPSIVGAEKDNKDSYIEISKRLNVKPEEILFIDDDENFLNAAKSAGLETYQFINNEGVKEKLNSI